MLQVPILWGQHLSYLSLARQARLRRCDDFSVQRARRREAVLFLPIAGSRRTLTFFMQQTNTTQTETSNGFARLLSEFREGRSLTDLSEAVQQCVAAVKDTGKPARLGFTLTFTPSGPAIVLVDEIKVKLPACEREQAIFFATSENTLSRSNPAQRELELREVTKPQVEVRELSAMNRQAQAAS